MTGRARLPAALAAAAALALHAGTASAADDAGGPYRIRPAVDLPVTVLAAAAWAVPQFFGSRTVMSRCPCRAADVNALDRPAVGLDSRLARTSSDIAVAAMVALPFGLDALDVGRSGDPWRAYLADALVMGQAIVVSGAVNQAIKLAARRPRPLAYGLADGDPTLARRDTYLSFYSAHTSTALAAGMAYATTFSLRHPGSRARGLVYAAAAAAGASVGVLRVLGGKHFPTDVATGALAGTAIGLALPRLHRRAPPPLLAVPAPGGASLMIAGRFD